MSRSIAKCPMSGDRLGWHNYYVARFDQWVRANDRYSAKTAEHLALWYLFLHLSETES